MPIVPTAVLPKRIPHGPLKPSTTIQVSPQLLEAAATESEEVLRKMNTSKDGLAGAEAERRLQEYGPNVVARETRHSYLRLLGKARPSRCCHDSRLSEDRRPMEKLVEFNPLKSIAIPNVGKVQPRGLVVIIGPNSSGKTQTLRDIQARLLGQPRKLVVCDEVEVQRPSELNPVESNYSTRLQLPRRTGLATPCPSARSAH
jgi:Cation transporter/ATPase, N-terminus